MIMNSYLIFDRDCPETSILIKAKDEEKAIETYFNNLPMHKDFVEDIHDKAINMCFSEMFWIEILQDEPSSEEIDEYLPQFKKNVYAFFGKKKAYADLFLKHWDSKNFYPNCELFPEDMIEFAWRKYIKRPDYTLLQIIDLDDIPYFECDDD